MIAAVILIFAAVFMSVLAVFFAVTAAWQSPAAELKRRLRRMQKNDMERPSEGLAGELLRETTPSEQFIFQLPLLRMVKKLVEHSGVTIKPPGFVLLTGILSALGFVALYALRGSLLAALLAAAVIAFIPFAYLGYRKQQRQTRFAEQLPDVLIMIARSLRAGHSLTSAVELVGQELPDPTGGLFKIAYEQQQLGMRISESLGTLLEKIDSIDLHFFVTIIRINSETGGNLAEILEKLAETIRSRLQIRRQVQVYTAEGRLSGYVLVLLPVVVFVAFYLKNPAYMEVFFTEQACKMSLVAAGLAQIAGFLMIRKIIDIRI
ncbi:MAG TPA: type II secretion system F family protein [Desulfuromonadaceae bacterium]